jgi:hypothetical protein
MKLHLTMNYYYTRTLFFHIDMKRPADIRFHCQRAKTGSFKKIYVRLSTHFIKSILNNITYNVNTLVAILDDTR